MRRPHWVLVVGLGHVTHLCANLTTPPSKPLLLPVCSPPPQVVPALDPATPIYASSFVMQLVKRRLTEYNLWDEKRFITFDMRQRFQAGPFE